jgi:phosphomevalonate kinase
VLRFDAGGNEYPPIVSAVLAECAAELGAHPATYVDSLDINTEAFHRRGRKLGYGSSAAATCALTVAILVAADLSEIEHLGRATRVALRAHRKGQGGRGSGYDVLTSMGGRAGLFTGGIEPTRTPVAAPWLQTAYLYRGPSAVSTSRAVAAYERWKRAEPESAAGFLSESNRLVAELATAKTWDEAYPLLYAARRLQIRLGDRLGVPAEPIVGASSGSRDQAQELLRSQPQGTYLAKSLGAGNETGLLILRDGDDQLDQRLRSAGFRALSISAEGTKLQ